MARAVVAGHAARTIEFDPLRFQIHRPYGVGGTTRPRGNIRRGTNGISRPLVEITLRRMIGRRHEFFGITDGITRAIAHQLQGVVAPNSDSQSGGVQIWCVRIRIMRNTIRPFWQIEAPLLVYAKAHAPRRGHDSRDGHQRTGLRGYLPIFL